MPLYRYQAVDSRGQSLAGVMPAPDEMGLERKLKEAGLWLSEAAVHKPAAAAVSAPRTGPRGFKLHGARGRREMIDFCTFMTFQLRVGIPVVKALEVAAQDCKTTGFKGVLADLQRQIESGSQLHEALARYPRVFTPHLLSVIKAGEATGTLAEAFTDLRDYLEWVDSVLADVRQASLYPTIVMTVIMAFVVFLFTFIIPKFSQLLTSLHVQQPLLTQAVFSAGDVVQATWWLWAPALVLFVLALAVGRRLSPRIGLLLDYLKLRLPVFGELNLMLALSRFTHNLAILYRSGLPIIEALALCRHGMIGNVVIEKAVGAVEQSIKTGSTISEALHEQPVFSALLVRMVAMGESSGSLDKALDNVSDYYTDVIPRRIKSVFSILEPALMLFLIFLVGCVALAIYLPILSLMSAIRR
jgi:type II secretory pathway component PulF